MMDSRPAYSWRFLTPLYMGSTLNPINSSVLATALVPIAAGLHVAVGFIGHPERAVKHQNSEGGEPDRHRVPVQNPGVFLRREVGPTAPG